MISIDVTKTLDTASPAIQALLARLTPGKIAERLAGPMVLLVKANFERLPQNKMGFPTSGFWKDCSRATAGQIADDGLLVYCNKLGVRQRYCGGAIQAGVGAGGKTGKPTQYLAIPAIAEAYQHTPALFDRLRFVKFGRAQDAPAALIEVPLQGPLKPHGVGRGSRRAFPEGPPQQPAAERVMYWLKKSVSQQPNPAVLPSDAEIFSTAEKALKV